jgi:hypothetical protein
VLWAQGTVMSAKNNHIWAQIMYGRKVQQPCGTPSKAKGDVIFIAGCSLGNLAWVNVKNNSRSLQI